MTMASSCELHVHYLAPWPCASTVSNSLLSEVYTYMHIWEVDSHAYAAMAPAAAGIHGQRRRRRARHTMAREMHVCMHMWPSL